MFQTRGTLAADSPAYVERPADQEILDLLAQGEIALVLAARQSGKSSLLIRAKKHLEDRGVSVAFVDLQTRERDATSWFGDVAYTIGRKLRLGTDAESWWSRHGDIGPARRFLTFVEDVLLVECTGHVALLLDEIDSVLSLPFSDDVFTTLRALYNGRAENANLRRLSFALAGLAAPSDLIRDRTRTPFNVGHLVRLDGLSRQSLSRFESELGAPVVDRIMDWTGGQPFLVQHVAQEIVREGNRDRTPKAVDGIVARIYLNSDVERDTHLKYVQDFVLDGPHRRDSLRLYARLLNGEIVETDKRSTADERLRLSGLVGLVGSKLTIRNRLYATIFNQEWLEKSRRLGRGHLARPLLPDSSDYLERSADEELLTLLTRGQVALVLAARRSGKTSLFIRAKARLADQGIAVAMIDLRPLHTPVREAESWFGDLVHVIGDELGLQTDRGSWWPRHDGVGPTQRFLKFVEDVVLVEASGQVVLLLDEIDAVLILPFSDEVLATLHAIDTRRAEAQDWNRLTYALAGLATPTDLAHDGDRTSYDVGSRVHLGGFDRESLRELDTALSAPCVDNIFNWTSGQPFLVQSLVDEVLDLPMKDRTPEAVDTLVDRIYLEAGTAGSAHLGSVRDAVLNSPHPDDVLRLYGRVLRREQVRSDHDSIPEQRLCLSGLTSVTDGVLVIGNPLYARAFDEAWVRRSIQGSREGWAVLSSVLLVAMLVVFVTARFALPHFPSSINVPDTSDPLTPVTINTSDTNISATEWRKDESAPWRALPAQGSGINTIEFEWSDLKIGLNLCELRFTAGWFDAQTIIPLSTHHYPGWHMWDMPRTSESPVRSVAFAPNWQLASAVDAGTITLWDPRRSGEKLLDFVGHVGPVNALAFSPSGTLLVSAGDDTTLKAWDVRTGREIWTAEEHASPVLAVAFSRDGETFASASSDRTIKVWDSSLGRLLRTLRGHTDSVHSIAFNPDGRMLASASSDRTLKLWNLQTGRLDRTFNPGEPVLAVAFDPAGATLASGGSGGVITLWDPTNNRETLALQGHSGPIHALAFSRHGNSLASASGDRTLKLWDPVSGEERRTLSGHASDVDSVAFSPDGQTLASGGADGLTSIWWIR